jgi:hypothetical protein
MYKMKDFFDMSLYLQLAVPIGYLSYLIARCGVNSRDKEVFSLYISMTFSLISIFGYKLYSVIKFYDTGALIKYGFGLEVESIRLVDAILLPFIIAVLWRKCGSYLFFKFMSYCRISNQTSYKNTLDELIENTAIVIDQITVWLKSGEQLTCDDVSKYLNLPIHGYRIDNDGNIAIYVDRYKNCRDCSWQNIDDLACEEVSGKEYGRLTFIKSSEVERIEFVTSRVSQNKVTLWKNFMLALLRWRSWSVLLLCACRRS